RNIACLLKKCKDCSKLGGIEVALYISFPEEEGFVSCESADLSWRGDIESTCQNRVTLFVLTPQS
ncbi:hypothetical protein EV126DRAFT_334438, partial [Verticillium dahliae]